ncbi:MAG: lysophospholipid acyltransferase family protein [Treponema sp.]|uniref:lysophospholipid acyltransferase family protein n=1 Tax=Treponema sp. TaxID=166 RepID=UPI003FA2AA4B
MLGIICILCCIGTITVWASLNRFAYVVHRPWCKKINAHISTVIAHRFFAIFNTYMHFRFAGDYTLVPQLPEQYLLISNHQSLLDIVVFMNYLDGKRLRFVAKKELANHVPLVSVMLKSDEHCLVQRSGSPSQAMQSMDSFAARVVKNNWIPILFPEGTRSKNGKLGTFHAAGFRRFLSKAPMPVVVAALDGGWNISSIPKLLTNLRGGAYHIKVLKVYPAPTTKEAQLKVLEEGKSLIQEQLIQWRKSDS